MNGQAGNNVRVIDFMRWAPVMVFLSAVLTLGSVGLIVFKGLNFGLDFTGGTVLEVRYPAEAQLDAIRRDLGAAGYGEAVVQNYGSARDVLVRIPPREGVAQDQTTQVVFAAMQVSQPDATLLRSEFVGPAVGEELRDESGVAFLVALGLMMLYISVRFVWRLSLGAVIALFHDAIITIGFFALTGYTFDLTVLAAVLAVIGYSINDTIVIADRIRENFRTQRTGTPAEIINLSITQTLSRTFMTGISTLLAVVSLLFFGGETLSNFSLGMLVGVTFGIYSSVYVAGALMLYLGVSRDDFIVKVVEEVDDRP